MLAPSEICNNYSVIVGLIDFQVKSWNSITKYILCWLCNVEAILKPSVWACSRWYNLLTWQGKRQSFSVTSYLLAMFHSRAGFWEFLSLSVSTPPVPASFSGFSWSHCAVPILMDCRSIWYCLSSISDPGSRRIPKFKALL